MSRPKTINRETLRTERLSLALTPATYQSVTTLAQIKGVSVNDLVASILDAVVEKNRSVLERFNDALVTFRAEIELEVEDDEKN